MIIKIAVEGIVLAYDDVVLFQEEVTSSSCIAQYYYSIHIQQYIQTTYFSIIKKASAY